MNDLNRLIKSLQGPIIILGASGFIGANLFKVILKTRSDVYAVINRNKGWRLIDIPDDKIINVDINSFSTTKNLIDSLTPKTVFDCIAYGAYSFEEDSTLIYQTNFLSTVKLIEYLALKPLAAFVHAGSSSEYGKNCAAPLENEICVPNSPYAVSKVAIANYLCYVGQHKNFPCINLRLYSVYGPLEDTSRLIPNLLRNAMVGKLPPFVNASTSRDFVHVDDVCEAFIMAAAEMHPGIYGESINIGTGIKTTIKDLATLTINKFNIKATPNFGSMEGRVWDLTDWYSNPQKAKKLLGWEAKISLSDGLISTSKWVESLTKEALLNSTKKDNSIRKKSLSAIIACYKDALAIPIMYKKLTEVFTKLEIDYEIIFVNDCSPDESEKIILDLSSLDPHVIGISHSRNFGSQMAFRSGMELSSKEGVVLLDGDLQDPPELIEKFYNKWEEGFDVIYGRRIKRQMPWYWGMMYKSFYRIFALFSYIKIPLDAGDFSLMDRRVVGWLLSCPERDLFIRGLRAYIGFKQEGIDYERPDRMFGASTNSLLKNIDWAKKGIFSYSNVPLTMLTSIGIIFLIISIFIAFVVAFLRIFRPDIVPPGITTVLIVILIFGSFNIFAIGLVGEYISKILIEVKERPRLIRRALIRNGKSINLMPVGILK